MKRMRPRTLSLSITQTVTLALCAISTTLPLSPDAHASPLPDAQTTTSAILPTQTNLAITGAALKNGKVHIWGFRGSAQQGNEAKNIASKAPPAQVESLHNIQQLTGGAYHLLALDDKGDVYGWGQNLYGETGCPGNDITTPCKVLGSIKQIAAGEYFSMALDHNGTVWSWGQNLYGQLGNDCKKTQHNTTPSEIDLNGETARLIGAAHKGAFAVTQQGHVWAWGNNQTSGLGLPGNKSSAQQIAAKPTLVPELEQYAHRITYIAGGDGWGEALLNNGTVIGWGLRAALGIGVRKTNISDPGSVEIIHNIKQLFARHTGSIALSNDGDIFTWGKTGGSAFPMIYSETVAYRNVVNGTATAIGGGKEFIYYLNEENKLYGVGSNDLYKLDQKKCCGIIDWPGTQIQLP